MGCRCGDSVATRLCITLHRCSGSRSRCTCYSCSVAKWNALLGGGTILRCILSCWLRPRRCLRFGGFGNVLLWPVRQHCTLAFLLPSPPSIRELNCFCGS